MVIKSCRTTWTKNTAHMYGKILCNFQLENIKERHNLGGLYMRVTLE